MNWITSMSEWPRRALKSLLGTKLQVRRVAVPLWSLLLPLPLIALAAGQAVGPIIAGAVTGSSGLTVEQTIVVTAVEFRDYPPALVYSGSPRDDQLRVIDTNNPNNVVATISSVTITLIGETVSGTTGLAINPVTSELYALLKLQGQAGRELVTIIPDTGVATSIGDTGDRFSALAFNGAGVLYAVTGDGAGVPETLYTLSLVTATPTFVMTLGNGNEGEALAFNPDDDLLYPTSGLGIPNINEIYETINPTLLSSNQITLLGQDYAEATAMGFLGNSEFYLADLGRRLYRINTEGVVGLDGACDHGTKGLAPFALAHVDDSLAVINDEGTSFTAGMETHVGDTFMLILALDIRSDADATATLELEVHNDIDIGAQDTGSVHETLIGKDTYLLKVESSITEGQLKLILSPKDDFQPGFRTIKGKIIQITG